MMRSAVVPTAVAAIIVFSFLFLSADAQEPGTGRSGNAPARGQVEGHLTWFDRQGNKVGTLGSPGFYRTLTISPDGKRVAVERTDPETQNRDIWLLDVSGAAATRFTSDPGWDAFPTWSPDGGRIIFTSNRNGTFDLFQKNVRGSGSETLLYRSTEGKGPNAWSPDGKFLIYYSLGQPTHLRLLAIEGPADRQPVAIVDTHFTSITGRFSPDGRWIAYSSNESGRSEIAVRSFDAATGSVGAANIVSKDGGRTPLWSGDGKEIFYINADGMTMAMPVSTGSAFQAGTARTMFRMPSGPLFWEASPDGRFLMPVPDK